MFLSLNNVIVALVSQENMRIRFLVPLCNKLSRLLAIFFSPISDFEDLGLGHSSNIIKIATY